MILSSLFCLALAAEIPVWPGAAPGSEGKTQPEAVRVTEAGDHVVSSVHKPTLTVYPTAQPNGWAVVIAPGGGHRELWTTHEGHTLGQWLASKGVSAFVLKYRLAREKDSTYSIEDHAFADMNQAVRLVKSRAKEWGVDPARVGVMGFSAGGELAAMSGLRAPADAKPAFQVLVYPAIPKETPLSKDTPRAFLICGENDRQNISQGLPELYLKMKQAGVSAELHVYAGVGHGFGVRPSLKGPVAAWPERFLEWLLR
jgi:endo-1,4-beta-xylanase